MKKTGLRMVVIAALVLVAWAGLREKKVKAGPQLGIGEPACVSYVPRTWGQYRGGSEQSGLAFEDASGTLRFITNFPCSSTPQVALEIRRTTPDPAPKGN